MFLEFYSPHKCNAFNSVILLLSYSSLKLVTIMKEEIISEWTVHLKVREYVYFHSDNCEHPPPQLGFLFLHMIEIYVIKTILLQCKVVVSCVDVMCFKVVARVHSDVIFIMEGGDIKI